MLIAQSLQRRRLTCENPVPASRLEIVLKRETKKQGLKMRITLVLQFFFVKRQLRAKAFAEQILRFDTDVIANAAKVKAGPLSELCICQKQSLARCQRKMKAIA